MSEKFFAKEELLAAAINLIANRLSTETRMPGPHDDATAEIYDDVFDEAVTKYSELLQD